MSQYRTGIYTSTTALASSGLSLELGFVPDKFQVTNWTNTSDLTGVSSALWIRNVTPNAAASVVTLTAGVAATSYITTNGFTPLSAGAQFTSTNYAITGISKANPGVVTMASTTGLANGDTITISNVVGMTQVNTQRYIVTALTSTTFALYDLFNNPVNTSAYGTWVSGGIANVISTPSIAPVIDATTGRVLTPGQPPGLVVDTGYYGITLGTSVVGANGEIIFWEAFYSTPTGW